MASCAPHPLLGEACNVTSHACKFLPYVIYTPRERQKTLAPRPRRRKSPAQLKSTLRFELHFRLCFGKADMAEWLRLELSRGFRDTSRIAFFRTFFSKKKVHKVAVFAGNFRLDDTCSFCKSQKSAGLDGKPVPYIVALPG